MGNTGDEKIKVMMFIHRGSWVIATPLPHLTTTKMSHWYESKNSKSTFVSNSIISIPDFMKTGPSILQLLNAYRWVMMPSRAPYTYTKDLE
jgi:hypothetical protein